MTGSRPRSRTTRQPPSKRRRRRPPVPQRGWQQHKAKATAVGRTFGQQSKSITRSSRKMARRKGAVYGLGALALASVAFTLAFTGAVSEIAAWELGVASDGLYFGVGWIVGDLRKPPDQSKLKRTAAAAKARAALCGAPTVEGKPCQRRGKCPHHKGGGSGKSSKPAKQAPAPTAGPSKTRPAHKRPAGPTVPNQGVPGTTHRAVNP
jgi:hypothetical protein